MSRPTAGRDSLTALADEPVPPTAHGHTSSEFGTPPDLVVDDEEKPGRILTGTPATLVTIGAIFSGLFALWQLFRPLAQGSQYYLILFLATVLPLIFLCYSVEFRLPWRAKPIGADRVPGRPAPWDWALAALALVACLYPVLPISFAAGEGGGYNAFLDRQGLLAPADVVFGGILLVLILEACRRTTGAILPAVCLVFLAYGYYGGLIPQSWSIAHAGMDISEIIDGLYNSGSGFYGTPLDVAATYILLFTVYGVVLQLAGAGKFFVDLSVASFRGSRSAPGRTAVSAGFLLGTVSGSGAATTVSIGAVTWPILKKAGYPAERAGGMLAAAGVGAILSPPTLGAAAFIIAEYIGVSYLKVLGWATIPTVLYYLGILMAVEIDARRSGTKAVDLDTPSPLRLLLRFGYHFLSLFVIIGLLAIGFTATRAVVWATLLALFGWIAEGLVRFARAGDRSVGDAAWSAVRQLFLALAEGVRSVLPVVAVCAAAGVIAVNTTKTGLGPQAAGLLIKGGQALADDPTLVRLFTALFAAIALTLLGLAVPVTASFIIGWVIIGPALFDLGVSEAAVAMFVFYFAVLSEVTPPTALASVAAAAVTGGRIVPTMWQTLRYALPAYAVPIAFVAAPAGNGLLGLGPGGEIAYAFVAAAASVVALAVATGGWIPGVGRAGTPERILAAVAGVLLLWLSPASTAVGVVVAVITTFLVYLRRRRGVVTPEGELS